MEQTRGITSIVIVLAIVVIIVAFTPLRWLFVGPGGGASSSNKAIEISGLAPPASEDAQGAELDPNLLASLEDLLGPIESDQFTDVDSTPLPENSLEQSRSEPESIETLIEDIEALLEVIEEPNDDLEKPGVGSQAVDQRSNIRLVIEQWRQARQNADIASYLKSYSSELRTPDGSSLQDWQASQRRLLSATNSATVRLTDIEVGIAQNNSSATVRFEQEVRSDSDYTWHKKRLGLVLEAGQWRIVEETIIE